MKAQKLGSSTRHSHPQPAPARPAPKWWRDLSPAEQDVIRSLFHPVRVMKQSPSSAHAQSARKWERKLTFFVKLQLVADPPRAKSPASAPSPTPSRNSTTSSPTPG